MPAHITARTRFGSVRIRPPSRRDASAYLETSRDDTGRMSSHSRRAADIAPAAALFADPTRARIVTALVDGRTLPASLVAQEAGVSASTASEHLAKLVAGGALTVEQSGRHRYYRLAGADVAAVVEALA